MSPGVGSIGDFAFSGCDDLTGLFFRGNAPAASEYLFLDNPTANIYRLPTRDGWLTTFGGRPTSLWPAQILPAGPGFGSSGGRFEFAISWPEDRELIVETIESLQDPSWTPLSTNSVTGGWAHFEDLEAARHPSRFYRVRTR